jgi:hypothetical protein
MLIDRTYFIGELNIPNANGTANNNAVPALTDWFIEKYEEKFLKELLGHELYKALKAGMLEDPVPQKWTDLIEGVEYTDTASKIRFWPGLIIQPPSVLNALDAINTISVEVGGGGPYDPVVGQASVTIPPSLVGKDFIIEQRGVGQLLTTEYSIVGNTLTLTSGLFGNNDVYFYKSATLAINTSTGAAKQSPIANYVYYWYIRNNYSQTSAMGEVKSKTENADRHTPGLKMTKAWNEMSDWVWELRDYLDSKKTDYPEWEKQDVWCMLKSFRPINEFNI